MNQRIWAGLVCLLLCRSIAAGQISAPQESKRDWTFKPKFEMIASVAVSHVFRVEDKGFGTEANAGLGVEVPVWRGLRAAAEVDHTFGLYPIDAKCGSISPGLGLPAYPCTGSARVGVETFTAASFTAGWYLGNRRVQPYVFGGLSVLRSKEYDSVSIVHADHVELSEIQSHDTGVGLTLGAGLRASVTPRISIRPEFRLADGTARSTANLSQFRFSLGLGYAW